MILWAFLIISVLCLCFAHDRSNKTEEKWALFIIIFIFLTYFSGFRDGLGLDYDAYKHYNSFLNYQKGGIIFSEPVYLLLSKFIYKTSYSYVLFFLTMSFITIYFSLNSFNRYNNLFTLVFVFVLMPSIYMTSFNLVRGAASSAIFIYSIRYLENKSSRTLLLYFSLILFAFFIHKSSLVFLIPLFFDSDDYLKFSFKLLVILVFVILFFNLFQSNLMAILEVLSYSSYIEYDEMKIEVFSLSNIFYHLLLLPLFYYRKRILNLRDSKMYIIPIKCFMLSLFFANISAFVLPFSYRLFYLFIFSLPIVVLVILMVSNNYLFRKIIYLIIACFGLKALVSGIGNPIIIPESIRPPISIYDHGVLD